MRLDSYIRVSRVGGRAGDSFISPDVQREQIAAAALLVGASVAGEHVDLDESGANGNRPGWQAALARVEAGETDGLIVAKLDRFARSTLDAAAALRRIEAAGGHFVSAAERFDTTTPFGRFALTVMFALAELEHARIAEAWEVSAERSIRRGAHTVIPFGYARGPGKRLVVQPGEALAVRQIFARRGAGASWTAIVDELNAAGMAPRRAAAWSRPAVKRIVASRVHTGEAFYGVHRHAGAHEALVDEQAWQAAQVSGARHPRRADGGALLAGLVRCAGCSYKMSGGASNGQRMYVCVRRHGGGRCEAGASITQRLLDEHVEALFLARVGDLRFVAVPDSQRLAAASARAAAAHVELVAWRDDTRARAIVGHEHYLAGLQARASEAADARGELAAASVVAPAGMTDAAIWPELDRGERRAALGAGIDAVFVRRGRPPAGSRSRVCWRGEAPAGLSRQGRLSAPRAFEW